MTHRSQCGLAREAIRPYLGLDAWQIAEVTQAMSEADAGEFASQEALATVIVRHATPVAAATPATP